MNNFIEISFWILTALMVFIYLGYGLVLYTLNTIKSFFSKPVKTEEKSLPEIAVVIAAYNEEDIITQKLQNTFAQNYPKTKLTVYVVSDGSTDRTNEKIRAFPQVQLLYKENRLGKSAAINRVMKLVQEEITVFTDANTLLNPDALMNLSAHYRDSKTGGVSGEKRVLASGNENAAATEGIYWKYESFLKKQDARFNTLIGTAGELFSIRTHLFQAIPEDSLLDDFMISMNILRKGYRIGYEPQAIASETPSASMPDEYTRKVRIGAGGLQSVLRLKDLINPFHFGLTSLQYIFHRFSRWMISPILIPVLYLLNLVLVNAHPLYAVLFAIQTLFHLFAFTGWLLQSKNIRTSLFYIPYYFNFMHFCIIAGWFRFAKGRQQVTWQRANRFVPQS